MLREGVAGDYLHANTAEQLCAEVEEIESTSEAGDGGEWPEAEARMRVAPDGGATAALREVALGEHSAQWQSQAKHVFVLTSAGAPQRYPVPFL